MSALEAEGMVRLSLDARVRANDLHSAGDAADLRELDAGSLLRFDRLQRRQHGLDATDESDVRGLYTRPDARVYRLAERHLGTLQALREVQQLCAVRFFACLPRDRSQLRDYPVEYRLHASVSITKRSMVFGIL
jgi:hypothetical protein